MIMRKTSQRIVVVLCFALLSRTSTSALDLGVSFRLENLGFRTDRPADLVTFTGEDYLWGLSLFGTHTITENFDFETGFYNDNVLRNISYTLFSFRESFLSLGVGPFFGFFNSMSTVLKSGISTAVSVGIPGIAFLTFRADSTIGGRLIEVGDYIQERNDVSLGFYIPNAICTFGLLSKKFIQKQQTEALETLEVVDGLTEYSFRTDVYQKYMPYTVSAKIAYQNITKSYLQDSELTVHSLNSIVLGTKLEIKLINFISIFADLESSIYTFGLEELVGISNSGSFLFRLNTGVLLDFDVFNDPLKGR